MPKGIFISYRRDDSRHAAGRLADELSNTFGAEHVFRDVEGIELGLDFVESLEKALAKCSVMLVLIGRHWLDITDARSGKRRLDNPDDWIRQEIATALRRKIRVVPLFLEGAGLPEASELPEDLRPLLRRQALELADVSWRGDVQRLKDMLSKVMTAPSAAPGSRPGPAPATPPAPSPSPSPAPPADPSPEKKRGKSFWFGVVAVTMVMGAIYNWLDEGSFDAAPPPVSLSGFPSGYIMKACGCWGSNWVWTAVEPRCLSGQVGIRTCSGMCAPNQQQYGYVCK